MVFTWNHNDLGGADDNFFVRSILNSFEFVSYSLVATSIASDSKQFSLNVTAHQWLAIVEMVILTSLQMQDLADQEGDRARGRMILPLLLSYWIASCTVAIPVAA